MNKCDNYKKITQKTKVWSSKNPRLSYIFIQMRRRCYDPEHISYPWYGAKGIEICDEWLNNFHSFENWALANGYKNNLTIDRIDNTKNYCPDNCQWITLEDNAKKANGHFITVNGETHTGHEWSELLHISQELINRYITRYGIENTIEFIRRRRENMSLKPKHRQSYYDIYMDN